MQLSNKERNKHTCPWECWEREDTWSSAVSVYLGHRAASVSLGPASCDAYDGNLSPSSDAPEPLQPSPRPLSASPAPAADRQLFSLEICSDCNSRGETMDQRIKWYLKSDVSLYDISHKPDGVSLSGQPVWVGAIQLGMFPEFSAFSLQPENSSQSLPLPLAS